jgi:DNA-directed RNA polymerase subunit RPC12/RpoP
VRGRIALHLDPGLGWTKPLVVACCAVCGTELARNRSQDAAARAARHVRCPTCGTRAARRLPGTTSPATDLALTRRQPRRHSASTTPPWEESHMAYRSLWQIDMGDGTWAVCCMACRIALYRGPKAGADRAVRGHRCEPVVPLGRRRRRRPA